MKAKSFRTRQPIFVKILPDRKSIDENCLVIGEKVTGRRRFWAVFFDYVCYSFLYIFIRTSIVLLLPDVDISKYADSIWNHFWTFFCIFSLIQVLITRGYTLGHAICHLKLTDNNGNRASCFKLILRYFILWLFIGFPLV